MYRYEVEESGYRKRLTKIGMTRTDSSNRPIQAVELRLSVFVKNLNKTCTMQYDFLLIALLEFKFS